MGYHAKADFNLNDKMDFPDLVEEPKKKQNNSNQNAENFRDVM